MNATPEHVAPLLQDALHRAVEGSFRSADGTGVTLANWNTGEPNNALGMPRRCRRGPVNATPEHVAPLLQEALHRAL